MDSATIARSMVYSVLHRTLEAISSCPDLAILWPDEDTLDHVAAGFRARSRQGIMARCVRTVDRLFIRIHKPRVKEHPAPRFYSGHKKGFGLNLQETSKRFNMPNVKSKVEILPDGYLIGDATYPLSNRLLTPYPGTCLCPAEDVFSFFHSQARIAVEQAFGILMMMWGTLLKPLRMSLHKPGKLSMVA
ncbi:unnamed protein product [Discosporangium mesarthrocarpum]